MVYSVNDPFFFGGAATIAAVLGVIGPDLISAQSSAPACAICVKARS